MRWTRKVPRCPSCTRRPNPPFCIVGIESNIYGKSSIMLPKSVRPNVMVSPVWYVLAPANGGKKMYGRGISRPRGFSSLSGATSELTGQSLFRAQSAQVKADLLVQKRCQIDSNKLPRKAAHYVHPVP